MLIFSVSRYRAGKFRRLDLLIGLVLSTALMLTSLYPNALNYLLGLFSFEPGYGGRLIGLLVLSNFVIYLFLLRLIGQTNSTERNLSRLVKAIAKAQYREEYRQNFESGTAPLQIIIPAYNEAENIGLVLQKIPEQVLGLDVGVIVVVDGATDRTEAIARGLNMPVVAHQINRGGGAALKAGYELALEKQAQIVVTMDADGQHDPTEIADLVRPILEDEADLVNGSRVLGHYEKDHQVRAAGVFWFNQLISLLTWTRITDASNAFRAVRASELTKLDLRQDQFHASELLIDALKKGLRVQEVPITIRRRFSGESKKPPSLKYGWGFAKAIITTWLR
ncbi:MAG: glycosyltransferase [Anaerolineae bacterium]|nr:glycosyltransferase [Anaerolineae bacterium]